MASAVKAGEAFVEILARTTKFEKSLRRAQTRLKAFGRSATNIGKKLVGLSLALAAPFALSAKAFANFESAMAKVGTLLDGNQKLLKQFSKEVQGLAVEYGESTEVLAAGLFDIISASVPAEKAISVLRASIKLAKAGFTETSVAADALTTVLNAYGLSADKAADISDDLFSIAKAGKTDFEKLAPNIGKVATLAASAGVSFEELGAAIATITRAGVSTEESVTGVTAIISAFLKPTTDAAKLAKKLGFEMSAASLKAEGFESIFAKLENLDAGTLAKLFPNVRALKGILPLLRNFKSFTKDVKTLQNNAGATDKAYKEVNKTLTVMGQKLKALAQVVAQNIGATLLGDIKRLSKVLQSAGSAILRFTKNNRELVKNIARGVVVVGLLGTAFVLLGSSAAIMAFAIGGIASIVSGVVTVLALLATKIGIIGLVIVGVATIAQTQFNIFGKAADFLKSKLSGLLGIAKQTMEGIKAAVSKGDIKLAFEILGIGIQTIWTAVLGRLTVSTAMFRRDVVNILIGTAEVIANAWATTFGNMEIGVAHFASFFKQVFAGAAQFVLTQLETMSAGFSRLGAIAEKALSPIDFDLGSALKKIDDLEAANKKRIAVNAEAAIEEATKGPEASRQKLEDTRRAIKAVAEALRNNEDKNVKKAIDESNSNLKRMKDDLDKLVNQAKINNDPSKNKSNSGIAAGYPKKKTDKVKIESVPELNNFASFNPFQFERRSKEVSVAKQQLKVQKEQAKDTKKIRQEVEKGSKFA